MLQTIKNLLGKSLGLILVLVLLGAGWLMFWGGYTAIGGTLSDGWVWVTTFAWYWYAIIPALILLYLFRKVPGRFSSVFSWDRFAHRGVSLLIFLGFLVVAWGVFDSVFDYDLLAWAKQHSPILIVTGVLAFMVMFAPSKTIEGAAIFLQFLLICYAWWNITYHQCDVDPKTGLSPCALGEDGKLHSGKWKDCEDGHCVVGGAGSNANAKILKPQATADDANVAAQIAAAYKANPCLADSAGCKGKVKAPSFGPIPDIQLTYEGATAYVKGENGTPSESRICIEGGGNLSYDFVDATPGSEWDVLVYYRNNPSHPKSQLWTEGHPWQLGPKGPGWGAHCFRFTLIGDAKKYPSAGLTVKITGG